MFLAAVLFRAPCLLQRLPEDLKRLLELAVRGVLRPRFLPRIFLPVLPPFFLLLAVVFVLFLALLVLFLPAVGPVVFRPQVDVGIADDLRMERFN
jgi:hypothetical protein